MKINKKTYICNFCKSEGELGEDFDEDFKNHQGFWCCHCEAYTFYDKMPKYQNTLILENKASSDTPQIKKITNLNKRLSPLRYPGGKSKLIDLMYPLLNKDKLDTFVEVFAGGASFGLALLEAKIINKLILNDADKNVYALFETICGNGNMLIDRVKNYDPSKSDYFQFRENLNRQIDELDRAFYYLIINRCAYSGIFMSNPLSDIKSRYNKKALCERIRRISKMADNITIFNEDALAIVNEYYWHPETTLFIDPPYYKKGHMLYPLSYNNEAHSDLADSLHSLVKEFPECADILVTYDNTSEIYNMYDDELFHFKEVNRRYSI